MPMNITVELVQNAELRAQNTAMLGQLAQLNATVESLTQTIKELQEQKNKNSKNSSKPPSCDGLKRGTKDKSLREPSGKKTRCPTRAYWHAYGNYQSARHNTDPYSGCLQELPGSEKM